MSTTPHPLTVGQQMGFFFWHPGMGPGHDGMGHGRPIKPTKGWRSKSAYACHGSRAIGSMPKKRALGGKQYRLNGTFWPILAYIKIATWPAHLGKKLRVYEVFLGASCAYASSAPKRQNRIRGADTWPAAQSPWPAEPAALSLHFVPGHPAADAPGPLLRLSAQGAGRLALAAVGGCASCSGRQERPRLRNFMTPCRMLPS